MEEQKTNRKKLLMWLIPILLVVASVSASLLVYFGTITTNIEVAQSVKLNGNNWDTPTAVEYSVYNGWEQKLTSAVNLLTNIAGKNLKVDVTSTEELGITTTYDSVGLSTVRSWVTGANSDVVLNGDVVTLVAEGSPSEAPWVASESRIVIDANDIENLLGLTADLTLGDLQTISWDANVIGGYAPHIDLLVDTNNDGISDDSLVGEFAKVQEPCDNAPYPTGNLNTFGNKGILDNNAKIWLNSGDAGACGSPTYYSHTLADWKAGQTDNGKTINGNTKIVALELEIDAWISNSNSAISNIKINGVDKPIVRYISPLVVDKESAKTFYVNNVFANNLLVGSYQIETKILPYEEP